MHARGGSAGGLRGRGDGARPALVKLLGSVKYPYAYAQDVLAHSIEAPFICRIVASEIGHQRVAGAASGTVARHRQGTDT